jgi:hypothetical protein
MARVIGRSEATKRTTRGTKMLEAARKELKREAETTPPPKSAPLEAPPPLKRKKPRKCQFV